MRLIVRADDIGYSEAVNYGIEKSIRYGIIGSAGLMPNMPSASHGLNLIKDLDVCLGQHTNLCLGRPCSDPSKIPSLVQKNGQFKTSKEFRLAFKEGRDLIDVDEAIIEIEAQYHRFVELTGQKPDYFEAHAIASNNLFKALEIVAKEFNLPYSDVSPMMNLGTFNGKPIAHCPMNSMDEDYDPWQALYHAVDSCREDIPNVFVCHPGYLDYYLLSNSSLTVNRTKEVEMLCDSNVKAWLDERNVELITYRDI